MKQGNKIGNKVIMLVAVFLKYVLWYSLEVEVLVQ